MLHKRSRASSFHINSGFSCVPVKALYVNKQIKFNEKTQKNNNTNNIFCMFLEESLLQFLISVKLFLIHVVFHFIKILINFILEIKI